MFRPKAFAHLEKARLVGKLKAGSCEAPLAVPPALPAWAGSTAELLHQGSGQAAEPTLAAYGCADQDRSNHREGVRRQRERHRPRVEIAYDNDRPSHHAECL